MHQAHAAAQHGLAKAPKQNSTVLDNDHLFLVANPRIVIFYIAVAHGLHYIGAARKQSTCHLLSSPHGASGRLENSRSFYLAHAPALLGCRHLRIIATLGIVRCLREELKVLVSRQ